MRERERKDCKNFETGGCLCWDGVGNVYLLKWLEILKENHMTFEHPNFLIPN